jgi:hypothetical protein
MNRSNVKYKDIVRPTEKTRLHHKSGFVPRIPNTGPAPARPACFEKND